MIYLNLSRLSIVATNYRLCVVFFLICCSMHGMGSETWAHYGGSLSGDRYVANSSINPKNVAKLVESWRYRSGDSTDGTGYHGRPSNFKATPIVVDDKLLFSTGFNRVIAIDPATGEEIWRFDPEVNFSRSYSEMFTSRGVAAWSSDQSKEEALCSKRVFLGTIDARLIALNAATGKRCMDFGRNGTVDLSHGIPNYRKSHYSVTSPPTVVGDLIIVGLAVGDNHGVEVEPGVVRAFDVLTGKLTWSWDPIPRNEGDPGIESWENQGYEKTGGANVWSVMAADSERDMVFLPTTSPAPDFYGGERLGNNEYTNSIVALRASTGEFLWGYQVVRHDLWDYDLAAQPLLFNHEDEEGTVRPAVALATKLGFVFVLDRMTGSPLHPVVEVPVPQSDVLGEVAAKTQRFPKLQLHATSPDGFKLWGHTEEHLKACERMMEGVRFEGTFTPPSLSGTLLFPGNPGGTNWGSMAADQNENLGYLTVNRWPTIVRLFPRNKYGKASRIGRFNGRPAQFNTQTGTPYGMARFDPVNNDIPCFKGPWATLAAVDLNIGEIVWEVPAGTRPWIDLGEEANQWGTYTDGGPLVTSGGVVFLATSSDKMLRAHDGTNGDILWEQMLPAGAHATPMAYRFGGNEYIVITAGGELENERGRGDYVIAFALPIKD